MALAFGQWFWVGFGWPSKLPAKAPLKDWFFLSSKRNLQPKANPNAKQNATHAEPKNSTPCRYVPITIPQNKKRANDHHSNQTCNMNPKTLFCPYSKTSGTTLHTCTSSLRLQMPSKKLLNLLKTPHFLPS